MMKTANQVLACDDLLPSITKIGTNRFPCVGLILMQLQAQFRSLGRSSRASLAAVSRFNPNLTMKKTFALSVALLFGALTGINSVSAATHTWHGEGFFGNKTLKWSDPFNWDGGAPAVGEANVVLIFPPDTDTYVTNDIAGLVVDQIQISGTNYVLHGMGGGMSLTLLGSAPFLSDLQITGANNSIASSLSIVLSNTVSVSVSTNKTFTIKSSISGSGGLDKGGSGTLAMQTSGLNNTYTGATAVRGGKLLLSNGNAMAVPGNLIIGEAGGTAPCEVRHGHSFGIADNSVVTIYTNGTLNLWGFNDSIGALNLHGGEVSTDIGTLSLNGDVTATGYPQAYGIINLGSASRTFNCLNGGIHVSATLKSTFPNVGISKIGAGYLSFQSTNEFNGLVNVAQGTVFVNHPGALGSTSNGTIVSNGASLYIGNFISVSGEALTVQGQGDPAGGYGAFGFALAANWNGNVNLVDDTLVSVLSDSASSTLNGTVSGSGKLVKDGVGNLYLSGLNPNSNSGGAEVWEGGLLLNKSDDQYAVLNKLIIGATNGAAGSAFVTLYSHNQISDYADVTIRAAGTLNTLGYGEAIGSLTGSGPLNLSTSRFAVGLDGSSTTFSGPISGNGTTNLVKVGEGTLTLTAASTVSGRTLVSDGKLMVNANFGSSPVTVFNGMLAGTGSVGSVTVENGGELSPGSSPGAISILGTLTMNPGSIYMVELNGVQAGNSYDQTVVSTAVNLNNATLAVTLGAPTAVGNNYVIVMNYGAGAVTGTFNGLAQNSILLVNDQKFRVRYNGGGGNDISLTRENTAPQLQVLNGPAAWPEGSPLTLTGSYAEPDSADTVKLVVNWGDGTITTNAVTGGTFSVNHTYTDENPSNSPQDQYNITVSPVDSSSGIGSNVGRSQTITNVPPTLLTPVGIGVLPGQPMEATLEISDPGKDTFQAYVNYGAGGSAPAVPVNGNLVTLNYNYPSNGTYTVTVLVRDDDLGERLQNFNVIVGLNLQIVDAGSNVKLVWPSIAQSLFVESNTNLTTANWTVIPGQPALVGSEFQLTVPKTNPACFFRLGWNPNAQ
jgi:autotransporter-associated beta strand protein